MIKITERDNRLFLEYFDDLWRTGPDGKLDMSTPPALIKSIDITAHIERAIENVFHRPLKAVLAKRALDFVQRVPRSFDEAEHTKLIEDLKAACYE